ncbi:MAG: hypothetical protein AAGI68_16725 [Planctomycetota bacterium]
MHTDTGEIRHFLDEADAKRAGFDLPLTERQAMTLGAMPRLKRIKAGKALKAQQQTKKPRQQARIWKRRKRRK